MYQQKYMQCNISREDKRSKVAAMKAVVSKSQVYEHVYNGCQVKMIAPTTYRVTQEAGAQFSAADCLHLNQ